MAAIWKIYKMKSLFFGTTVQHNIKMGVPNLNSLSFISIVLLFKKKKKKCRIRLETKVFSDLCLYELFQNYQFYCMVRPSRVFIKDIKKLKLDRYSICFVSCAMTDCRVKIHMTLRM